MTETAVRRPAGVTFVVVLTWIIALLDLLGAAALLFNANEIWTAIQLDMTADEMREYGFFLLAVSVITMLVAVGLGNGNNFSRALVMALMVIRIAISFWAILAFAAAATVPALVDIAFALWILLLLSSHKASDFFRSR